MQVCVQRIVVYDNRAATWIEWSFPAGLVVAQIVLGLFTVRICVDELALLFTVDVKADLPSIRGIILPVIVPFAVSPSPKAGIAIDQIVRMLRPAVDGGLDLCERVFVLHR